MHIDYKPRVSMFHRRLRNLPGDELKRLWKIVQTKPDGEINTWVKQTFIWEFARREKENEQT